MDLSKLKNRPSFPIETIAVAVSFSPRCAFLLTEAQKLANLLDAHLLLLHIGERTPAKEQELDLMLNQAGVREKDTRVIWMEGDTEETILRLCKLNIVDLLILGALERENFLKFYIGSIARNISRRAKCSVLLLTDVDSRVDHFRKVIVNGVENPKTVHTINTSFYLARHLPAVKELTIVNELNVHGLAMAIADDSTAPEAREIKKALSEQQEENLQGILERADAGNIKVTHRSIKGKPGYAISNYAKTKKADLLVINSPDTNLNLLDRIFTHDIEYILADLPCNVLIVHSRING